MMSVSQGKIRTLGLVAALGIVLAATPAFAQQDGPPPSPQADPQGPPYHGPHGHGRMDPTRRLEIMTHALNLSPEQQTAIKQVWADQRAKWEANRQQGQQMSPEDRHAVMIAAHQDEKAKIKSILTADQKTRYDAMEARMRERRDREDNPLPPPPQQ